MCDLETAKMGWPRSELGWCGTKGNNTKYRYTHYEISRTIWCEMLCQKPKISEGQILSPKYKK